MGLLAGTWNCGLRTSRECWERFPHHRFQRKPLVSHPGMHHGTCVKHVPWCMSGSLTGCGGENGPGIPSACVACDFVYLGRCPCNCWYLTPMVSNVLATSSLLFWWVQTTIAINASYKLSYCTEGNILKVTLWKYDTFLTNMYIIYVWYISMTKL